MITSQMMCVSKPTNPIDSTCNGDSGSSVIFRNGDNYETIGIVSWGIEGCQAGKASVMARVTSFLSWIKAEISDSALCPRSFTPPPTTSPPTCVTIGGAVSGLFLFSAIFCVFKTYLIQGEPCVFPFIVGNVTITGCTKIDGDSSPWCATKTDSQGSFSGQWGYCPDTGCPVNTP